MDRCKHVGRLRLARDHSILNPQKWHCADCNTTESVWACLGCAHVACGRYIEEHALRHFQEQRHPLALELNELYVFCYLCDDYVLNDNATGDLRLLRSTLSAIQSQRYDLTTRSGRTLRSAVAVGDDPGPGSGSQERQLRDEDRMFTALWHRRRALIGRVFRGWLEQTEGGRKRAAEERKREEEERREEEEQEEERRRRRERRRVLKRQREDELEKTPTRKSHRLRRRSQRAAAATATSPSKPTCAAKRSPAPALHQTLLDRCAHTLSDRTPQRRTRSPATPETKRLRVSLAKLPALCMHTHTPGVPPPRPGDSPVRRRPTVPPGVTGLRNLGNTCYMNSVLQVLSHTHLFRECFLQLDLTHTLTLLTHSHAHALAPASSQSPTHASSRRGVCVGAGLSGGASHSGSMELIQREPSSQHLSLCHELHTLFQVMWCGKWALVSPFSMLHSVWQLIPAFRGYAQQDAQEFLCQLLDKVQRELESTGTHTHTHGVLANQRRLIKQVLSVVNTIFHGQLLSQVTCLACDYRSNTVEPFWDLSLEFPERYHSNSKEAGQLSCQLTEMLAKFTETEALEGSIYACEQCNNKRRRSSSKPVVLTEAQKQLMVHKLPHVLRLHLKRFRWSGRNHREKIGVHVSFEQELNMEPYCCRDPAPAGRDPAPAGFHFLYQLSAVVMHHGKGFGSGHYTAYCYNTEGGFWVHCNDSKLSVCGVEEVCKAQAYILFYTQRVSQGNTKHTSDLSTHHQPL